jgi:arylamine N-acetyltransferase
MLDVGFGGDGATKPLPLISGHVEQNLGFQEIRLVHDNLPEQLNKSQKFWIYEYRNGKDKEWNSFYCFPELEFLAADFEVMNFYTSTSPAKMNFQPRLVLIIRFLREEQTIVGKVMMVGAEVKSNMGGKTVLVRTCTTEKERIEALKEHFNMTLTEEEIDGVKGRSVELV